jgi:DNA-binding NtrC family response regulator
MAQRHSILVFVDPNAREDTDLRTFFGDCGCEIVEASELDVSLECVQQKKFDVIILDAEIQGMQIDRFIHILKEIDPVVKIIVKTRQNSKMLEAKIRKEKIFYYHVDSFGADDLKLAIRSALKEIKQNPA